MDNPIFNKTWFNLSFASLVAGSLVGSLAEIIIEPSADNNQNIILVAILCIFVILITLFSIATIESVFLDVTNQLDQISLISLWMTEQGQQNLGYLKSKEVALSAKKSILVISHYRPAKKENGVLEDSPSRKGYLSEGIEEVIKQRLSSHKDSSFIYQRIIQSDNELKDGGLVDMDVMENDNEIFKHCKSVSEIMDGNTQTNVQVNFRLSKPIPSFPSTLIIDDRYLLFALSAIAPPLSTGDPHPRYDIAGVLFIEDREGKVIQGFKTMFDRYYENSESISYFRG